MTPRVLVGALVVSAFLFTSLSCSTVTMKRKGVSRISRDADYNDSKPYFLWGLIGKHKIDVKEICGGRDAVQWQAESTAVDSLLTFVTLGIYSPRSAKVWCSRRRKGSG